MDISILKKLKLTTLALGLVLFSSASCKPEKKKGKPRAQAAGADATFAEDQTARAAADAAAANNQPTWTETTTQPENGTESTSTFTPISGCLKDQQIQQMEIVINGAIASPKVIDSSSGSQKFNQGVPGQITFEFNDGFAYTETDGYNRLMTNQGRITINDFTSYTVDQIQYIKVTLGGHSFRNDPFTEYDFWKGEKVRYRVTETSQFAMNTFTVIINGKEYYKQGALNTTLGSKSDTWRDDNLAGNLVTKKILEESCAAPAATDTTGSDNTETENQFE